MKKNQSPQKVKSKETKKPITIIPVNEFDVICTVCGRPFEDGFCGAGHQQGSTIPIDR